MARRGRFGNDSESYDLEIDGDAPVYGDDSRGARYRASQRLDEHDPAGVCKECGVPLRMHNDGECPLLFDSPPTKFELELEHTYALWRAEEQRCEAEAMHAYESWRAGQGLY